MHAYLTARDSQRYLTWVESPEADADLEILIADDGWVRLGNPRRDLTGLVPSTGGWLFKLRVGGPTRTHSPTGSDVNAGIHR